MILCRLNQKARLLSWLDLTNACIKSLSVDMRGSINIKHDQFGIGNIVREMHLSFYSFISLSFYSSGVYHSPLCCPSPITIQAVNRIEVWSKMPIPLSMLACDMIAEEKQL